MHLKIFMIQRIQTLLLLFAAIINSVLFYIPFATIITNKSKIIYRLTGIEYIAENSNSTDNFSFILLLLNSLIILLYFVVIFLFKKRILQIKISQLSLLLNLALISLVFFAIDNIEIKGNINIKYNFLPFVLIFLSIILIFFSIKNIKKDEEIVRASERIR